MLKSHYANRCYSSNPRFLIVVSLTLQQQGNLRHSSQSYHLALESPSEFVAQYRSSPKKRFSVENMSACIVPSVALILPASATSGSEQFTTFAFSLIGESSVGKPQSK